MTRKILIFDDTSIIKAPWTELLIQEGFEVVFSFDYDELKEKVKTFRADLLIHGADERRTHWELCQKMCDRFPRLPVLHVFSEGSTGESHEALSVHKNSLFLPASEKEFLAKVKKLSFFGRLENQKARRQALIEKLDEALDFMTSRDIIVGFMKFLTQLQGAENAFWVAEGDVDFYVNEMWKVKSLVSAGPFRPRSRDAVISTKNSNFSELTELLRAFNEAEPEWQTLRQPILVTAFNKRHMIVPLFDKRNQIHHGHIILAGPKETASREFVPYALQRASRAFDRAKIFTEVQTLNFVDDISGLYNQRFLKVVLDQEINTAKAESKKFSVLFIDVDFFKKVNDVKGHLVGTKLLQRLSVIFKENIRVTDYAFRYGGDEFILLLTNTDIPLAKKIGERIRSQVERAEFVVDGNKLNLTLSIGIACFPDHARSRESIVRMADKAMYEAKHKSRNVVYVAS